MQDDRNMTFRPEVLRDQLDQDLDCLRECTYVEEAPEINQLIQHTVETHGSAAQAAYPRFRKIVSSLPGGSADTKLNIKNIRCAAAGEIPRAVTAP